MTEYDPEHEIFFGFVTGMAFPEWGRISLQEFILRMRNSQVKPFGAFLLVRWV